MSPEMEDGICIAELMDQIDKARLLLGLPKKRTSSHKERVDSAKEVVETIIEATDAIQSLRETIQMVAKSNAEVHAGLRAAIKRRQELNRKLAAAFGISLDD